MYKQLIFFLLIYPLFFFINQHFNKQYKNTGSYYRNFFPEISKSLHVYQSQNDTQVHLFKIHMTCITITSCNNVELPTWLQTFVLSKSCLPPNGNQMVIFRRTFKFVVCWHPRKPRKLVYHE